MTDNASAAPPVAFTIAGSDSSGGAGIQADLKTFAALGCFGASAITAVTAQNTTGVQSARLMDVQLVREQIHSVAADLPIAATKTGMLGSVDIVEAVADAIEEHGLFRDRPFVLDPVMRAKSGDALIDDAAVDAVIRRLIPLADLVTPNRHEAARLCGFTVDDTGTAARAAETICATLGARACVVKGICASEAGNPVSIDFYCDGRDVRPLIAPLHNGGNTHGSGCTFAAAITALIAHGRPLAEAVHEAKRLIDAALASPMRLGHGISPVDHRALTTPK